MILEAREVFSYGVGVERDEEFAAWPIVVGGKVIAAVSTIDDSTVVGGAGVDDSSRFEGVDSITTWT